MKRKKEEKLSPSLGSLFYTGGDNDYTLKEDEISCWVQIDNISIYIRRTDEGVAVDLYPHGRECEDALCGTWALFNEANLFNNTYHCKTCNNFWEVEWSCVCDDRCPQCNTSISPYESEELN